MTEAVPKYCVANPQCSRSKLARSSKLVSYCIILVCVPFPSPPVSEDLIWRTVLQNYNVFTLTDTHILCVN